MASKKQSGRSDSQREEPQKTAGATDKVGSSDAAAAKVGGPLDFGVPAAQAKGPVEDGGRAKGPEQGTGPTRSGTRGVRTVGVGAPVGPDGAGSGGDLDPDVIGLDGRGGVALNPGERNTQGANVTQGGSAPFASGAPAKGDHTLPPGQVGGAPARTFDTVDHTGGDVTTSGSDTTFEDEVQNETASNQ
jgi:hypothetical protein